MIKSDFRISHFVLLGLLLGPLNANGDDAAYSDIAADETVVFFRTSAWLDLAAAQWHVPIHGWIYEPQDSATRKGLFKGILKTEYDLSPDQATEENFKNRINLMIADNERDKQILVSIAGRIVTLPASGVDGHFQTTLILPADEVDASATASQLPFEAITSDDENRTFSGEVLLIEPQGLGIISDIDDTVKISNITNRRGLLESTFLQDFAAVPSMAKLYAAWSAQGASLHFVSSSPWQLYEPLDTFLLESGFPRAALELKSVRFRDKTLFNLFKKGTETKPAAIEKILAAYPGRKFILVGDSGEHDPEVYSALLRKHPKQVLRVYIRNVGGSSAGDERFRSLFSDVDDDRWELFDSADIFLPVEQTCCATF